MRVDTLTTPVLLEKVATHHIFVDETCDGLQSARTWCDKPPAVVLLFPNSLKGIQGFMLHSLNVERQCIWIVRHFVSIKTFLFLGDPSSL